MSEKRIDLSTTDKILEIGSWLFLLIIWLITIISYQTLPDKIPTHFNFEGIADNFGSKNEIFTLPVIAAILTIGLTILDKHLNPTNNLCKRKNLEDLYIKTRIIKFLKLAILAIFGMIIFHTVEIAKNSSEGLGKCLLIMVIAVINIPNLYYLIKLTVIKSHKK